jgi:hypothetical protein
MARRILIVQGHSDSGRQLRLPLLGSEQEWDGRAPPAVESGQSWAKQGVF